MMHREIEDLLETVVVHERTPDEPVTPWRFAVEWWVAQLLDPIPEKAHRLSELYFLSARRVEQRLGRTVGRVALDDLPLDAIVTGGVSGATLPDDTLARLAFSRETLVRLRTLVRQEMNRKSADPACPEGWDSPWNYVGGVDSGKLIRNVEIFGDAEQQCSLRQANG
jgi:hypothetical protein